MTGLFPVSALARTGVQHLMGVHIDANQLARDLERRVAAVARVACRATDPLAVRDRLAVLFMRRLHETLASTLAFQSALRSTVQRTEGSRWASQRIWMHPDGGCVALLGIPRHGPIPPHDHPGVCGALLVLEGEVTVTRFRLRNHRESAGALVGLCPLTSGRFGAGDGCIVDRSEVNIHGLSASSHRCIVLDVLAPPPNTRNRAWYFLLPQPFGSRLLATRVPETAFRKHRHRGRSTETLGHPSK